MNMTRAVNTASAVLMDDFVPAPEPSRCPTPAKSSIVRPLRAAQSSAAPSPLDDYLSSDFRRKLEDDPVAALASLGVSVSDGMSFNVVDDAGTTTYVIRKLSDNGAHLLVTTRDSADG